MTDYVSYKRTWYLKNRERILQKRKQHYIDNKEIVNLRNKEWAKRNPERSREIKRRWSEKHKSTRVRTINTSSVKPARIRRPRIKKPRMKRIVFGNSEWEKKTAREFFANLITRGIVARPTNCSECGIEGRIDAHHYNGYAKQNWLDIKWLCRKCHNRAHYHDAPKSTSANDDASFLASSRTDPSLSTN